MYVAEPVAEAHLILVPDLMGTVAARADSRQRSAVRPRELAEAIARPKGNETPLRHDFKVVEKRCGGRPHEEDAVVSGYGCDGKIDDFREGHRWIVIVRRAI